MPGPALVLFGSPRLEHDGRTLHVGTRKAIVLLTLLALDGALPRERLAAWLWPDVDGAAARRNLRREVFRLRALGCPFAESSAGTLALDGLTVDVRRFRAALAAADDAGALQAAGRSVFDGLDGVAGPDVDACLARWRSELLQQRAGARQRHAEALAERGELTAALALHLQALAEEPCDEAAARQAMQLHAALGDRAAALVLFARLTDALRAELDLAPAPETEALAATLRQGTSLPAAQPPAAASPRQAPQPLLAERLPFVGRSATRASIEAAWAAGRRVYLNGAPGAGKTRLATECAAGRGAWLRVACAPNDAELPYASAIRALRALQEAAPDVALPDWVRRELATLLPELGPAPQPLASPEAAERLRAAFACAWGLLVRDNFNALLLDDWQWGDPASVELWNRLDDAEAPIAWIVAYRSAQLPPAALQRMRQDVDAGRAVMVALEGLDADEALALVRALSGSPGGTLFARRLQQATEGNPFFLIETLRHLHEQGQLTVGTDGRWSTPFDELTADYAELPVPASVRDAVLGRVRALGETARRLLEAASLLGEPFELALLDGATGLPGEAAVNAMEHAQAARLLAEAGGGGYRFAHDLVRQCLAESLSPARRRLLHERLARRLEARGAAPALIAAQWEGAGQPTAAVPWRQRAAEAAWRVHALADTRAQYEHALADGAAGSVAVDIHLALARLHRRLGDAAALTAALGAAVQAAESADSETRLRARLASAEVWCSIDRADDGIALLDALAADLVAAPETLRARALATRARVLHWRGQIEHAQALHCEAVDLLEGAADALPLKAELLDGAARAAMARGDAAGADALIRRAVAAFEATGDNAGLSQALNMLGVTALNCGDRAGSLAALERARALAARCGHVTAERAAILNLVKACNDAGRTGEALALLDAGDALAPAFESRRMERAFVASRYYVHYARGELAQADAQARRLLALGSGQPDHRLADVDYMQTVVDLYLHTGALARARALLDEAEALVEQTMHGNGGYLRAPLAAKRAWLQLAEGDPAGALERMRALGDVARDEDRLLVAWVGAAAALALGDVDFAAGSLAAVDIAADAATELLALVLEQRLLLARAQDQEDDAARTRALALLAAGQVPALEARRLRAALG
jgi:DNA-binding SARP family transcriptional activator